MEAATRAVGVGLLVLNAAAESDLDAAFNRRPNIGPVRCS